DSVCIGRGLIGGGGEAGKLFRPVRTFFYKTPTIRFSEKGGGYSSRGQNLAIGASRVPLSEKPPPEPGPPPRLPPPHPAEVDPENRWLGRSDGAKGAANLLNLHGRPPIFALNDRHDLKSRNE